MTIIQKLNIERNIEESCDGLYSRFLMFNPQPRVTRIDEKEKSLNVVPLHKFLILIKELHREVKSYEYTPDDLKMAADIL